MIVPVQCRRSRLSPRCLAGPWLGRDTAATSNGGRRANAPQRDSQVELVRTGSGSARPRWSSRQRSGVKTRSCHGQPSKQFSQRMRPLAAQKRSDYFRTFYDRFESIEEVQEELRNSGLESSDLIMAIDFTKSNEITGTKTFDGYCLHSLQSGTNPYIEVMSILCETLSAFDDDQLIPAYGFGDVRSRSDAVFSFDPNDSPIHTLGNVLDTYKNFVAPRVQLSGPTSFAPAINKAMDIVRENDGRYHILVIIADGLIQQGSCMERTKQAIVEASSYPMSIIMVGVGDGPWDDMQDFDDALPARTFDNFNFVNFTEISDRARRQNSTTQQLQANFALSSLMEIPDQYAFILNNGMLGKCPPQPPADVLVFNPPG